MNQATQDSKPSKTPTEYITVEMEDGRKVDFPKSRKTDKTILTDDKGMATGVRFDFVNGRTLSLAFSELSPEVLTYAAGHGISQKGGDSYASVKEVDDMVISVEEIFARLRAGEWAAQREAGDSTAGASIVIRALVEATGKSVEFVKAFLQRKLDEAKARGEKLSRQDLYASFRSPTSKTGAIIKRLEEEKVAKATKVSAADLEAEMMG